MIIFITVILFLAVFHFLYESVILPTIRLHYRYKLFALRDELRMVKMIHGERFDNKIFKYMQVGLNNAINLLPDIDMVFAIAARNIIANDKELRERIKRRNKLLDECTIEDIKELRRKTYITLEGILIANSGGWFIYIVPVVGVVVFFKKIKSIAKKIMVVPEREIDIIASTYSLKTAG